MTIAFHTRSLRQGRVSIPNQAYILTAVTWHRASFFADFEIACAVSRVLGTQGAWPDARRLAWVLMPDHFHVLLSLGDRETISLVAQRLKSLASAQVRSRLGDVRVWQSGFHEHAVRQEEGLREVGRYIVANPLRARLVARAGDYPFWDAVWLDPQGDPLDA